MLRELLIEIGIDVDNDPISELNKEIDDLIKKLKKLDASEIEEMDKQFKEIVESTEDINKNLKQMEKGFKDVDKAAKRLEKSIEDVSDGIRDAERRTEDLNDSLRDSERNTEELSDGFRDANRQADRLADSLEDAEKETRNLTRQTQRLNDELEDAQREVNGLLQETRRLNDSFRDVSQSAPRISRELDSISFSGLHSEINRLESAFGGIVRAAQRASTEASEIGASAAGSASDVGRLERAFERVNQTVERINNGVDGIGNAAIGAAGAVGAGMGAQGIINNALASTSLDTKISIATDMSPKEQKAMRQAINESVAMGVDDISAFEGVRRQFSLNADAGVKANKEIIKSASAIAAAYDMVDFTELIQEVNEIGKELKISDKEAVAMTGTLLKGGFPPEQLDIISEYGHQMRRAGFAAEEIQAIMSAGVATGTWNIDNLLDGVKEGRILMAEYARGYPDAISDMLDELNLSSKVFDKWAKDVATGGTAGTLAMMEVSEYINSIKDPALQNEFGTAVFGTKWEDQGENISNAILNAKDHMKSLSDMQKQLNEDVDKLSDDPAVQLAKAFKDINTALQPLYSWVSGIVAKFAEWVSANPMLASGIAAAAVSIGILGAGLVGLAGTVGAFLLSWQTLKSVGGNILGRGRGGNVGPDGRRRSFTQRVGGDLIESFGGRRAIDHWPNPNNPNNPWTQMDREFNNNNNRNNRNRSTSSPSANNRNPLEDMARRYGLNPNDVIREHQRDMAMPRTANGSSELLRAASNLNSAAEMMKRALSNIRCTCNCGGVSGGRGGNGGRGGRGGSSPAGDLDRRTRSNTRSARNGRSGFLSRMSGFGGKGLGVVGTLLGGATLVKALRNKDFNGAAHSGAEMVGGAGGAWAGAAAGAALGSVIPGIGTAIGGAVGGIVGGIGGSALGSKLYKGIKSFDWSGLKSTASSTGQAVTNTWNSLKTSTGNAWNSMTSGMSGAMTGAKNAVSNTASALGSGLSSSWSSVKSVASGAWSNVKSILSNNMSSAKTTVSSTASSLGSGLSATWNATKSVASTVWGNLKSDMTTKSNATKATVSTAFSTMKSNLSSTWSGLKSIASSVWSGISSAITSSVSGAVSKATSMLNGLKTSISGVASKAWSGIKSGASKVKNWVMGSHATGLGRVPFDGYIAELHKNEAVLTANQANALRSAGILKGNGVAPQLNMPQATVEAAEYSPLGVDPSTTATTNTTNNNGTVRASVTINIDGSRAPQEVAVNIKDVLEDWFGSLSGVLPATLEG
ncbi:hypothetical protein AAHH17_16430 [Lysinibacillus capsici]|uniref:hypothetical protein n=1 Tax=Lysinibacillus capsici TaxID=2115968 RepID=UPI0032E3DD7C